MEHRQSDGHGRAAKSMLVREMERPEALREKCARMQAEAKYFGRGFRKERLDPRVYERIVAHFQANIARFRTENVGEEIGSVARQTIPSLVFEDAAFNAQLAQDLKPITEAWAGMPLQTSGIGGRPRNLQRHRWHGLVSLSRCIKIAPPLTGHCTDRATKRFVQD